MVEFVIVLPIMVLLVFMIMYAGIGFERYLRVTNAAHVAARAAAVARFAPDPAPCDPGAARTAVDAALPGLVVNIEGCVDGPPGSNVTVTLKTELPSIPIITGITGPITVTGSATERRE